MSRSPMAAIPTDEIAVPPRVRELTAGRALIPVWVNGLGAPTFRDPGPTNASARYVKWTAAGTPEIDLAAEAERLGWAAAHGAIVPEVLDHGADGSGSWLITAALDGESAVTPRWKADPERAARSIGAGLRALHDRLPLDSCPYTWSVSDRILAFEERVAGGEGPESWDPAYHSLPVADARALLTATPEIDLAVVCHGDACAPNTLLDSEGRFAAHVDLGSLGVADRWADLAVAAWSTEWNYGPGFEPLVYEGYGIDPDPERIAYYRLLWDLS